MCLELHYLYNDKIAGGAVKAYRALNQRLNVSSVTVRVWEEIYAIIFVNGWETHQIVIVMQMMTEQMRLSALHF